MQITAARTIMMIETTSAVASSRVTANSNSNPVCLILGYMTDQ